MTGILIVINNMPVFWLSKRQATVETSTYGSEIVAARIAVEAIMDFRYKLRMLGVPLEGPALMLGDNMSVVLNTTVPSSPLKKKHQACNFHRIREAIAAKVIRFAHIDSEKNYADTLTKPLPPAAHQALVKPWLFRQPPFNQPPPKEDVAKKEQVASSSTTIVEKKNDVDDNKNKNKQDVKAKASCKEIETTKEMEDLYEKEKGKIRKSNLKVRFEI